MSRLLETHPQDALVVLSSSYFDKISPNEGRLPCKHHFFPTTNETGPWGLGRLKSLIDWLMLPIVSLYGSRIVREYGSKAIITVAHGHFFVAAALAGLITGTPLILMVHDDWVSEARRNSIFLRYLAPSIFQFVASRAAHIYCVTPYMQELLLSKYRVQSEVQMPAAERRELRSEVGRNGRPLTIVYAGTGTTAMEDGLAMLVDLVRSDELQKHGISDWELHLYTPVDLSHPSQKLWEHERIKPHGWVDQEQLRAGILESDLLFLPFSFRGDERYATEKAFPAKTADYLASGKPILVLAPDYSSVVKYFRTHGCAVIVDRLDLESLAKAISDVANSEKRRLELRTNARNAFDRNHNIEAQRLAFGQLLTSLSQQNHHQAV